jgi:hypothetical protein
MVRKDWYDEGRVGRSKETQPSVATDIEAAPITTATTEAVAEEDVDTQPAILTQTKAAYLRSQGVKKSSPGYDTAAQQYERDLDEAHARLPFREYNEKNADTPESINRQAHEQLRQEFGLPVADADTTQFSKRARLQKGAPPRGINVKIAQKRIDGFLNEYKGANDELQVRVHATQQVAWGEEAFKGERVKGGYDPDTNTLHIVAANMESAQDLQSTLQHEIFVHKGLGFFSEEHSQGILHAIKENAPRSKTLNAIRAEIDKDYDGASDLEKAEELFARVAEKKMTTPDKYWNKIVTAVRKALRKVGLVKNISESDLRKLIYDMGDAFRDGREARNRGGEVAAMRGGANRQMLAQKGYHGSPHRFDKFRMDNIGGGEGAQAFGHGLYIGEAEGTGKQYAKSTNYADKRRQFLKELPEDADFDEVVMAANEGAFTPEMNALIEALEKDDWLGFDYPSQAISTAFSKDFKNFDPSPELVGAVESGYLYEVDVPDSAIEKMLDWDKPLSAQSAAVKAALNRLPDPKLRERLFGKTNVGTELSGSNIYDEVQRYFAPQRSNILDGGSATEGAADASAELLSVGIPGIKYLDASSRKQGDGTRNFVVFDESLITIESRNGDPLQQETSGTPEYEADAAASPNILASKTKDEAFENLGLEKKHVPKLRDAVNNVIHADWNEIGRRANEGVFDGLSGIKYALDDAGVDQGAYISARLATGTSDTMTAILKWGAPEWRDGVIQQKQDDTKGLLETFGDLGKDLNNFLGWMAGHRADKLMAEGRENNLTQEQINELKSLSKGKEELFEEAKRQYNQMKTAILDLNQQAGGINPETRGLWDDEWYVPFFRDTDASEDAPRRAFTKKGIASQSSVIKKLKGSDLATKDILENVLTNFTQIVDNSMKNMAMQEVAASLDGTGFMERIEKPTKLDWMAAGKPDSRTVSLLENGERVLYRVENKALLRSITQMNSQGFQDPITKTGRFFKRLLTTGVTAAPDFIVSNFVRDAAHAWAINKDGFTFGKDSFKGLKAALAQDDDYKALMFAGASFQGGYVHGTDPEKNAQIVRRALLGKGLDRAEADGFMGTILDTPQKLYGAAEKGWQWYREKGDRFENANRLATFKAAMENEGKSFKEALFEAKDLMDYSMRGNFAALQWFTDVTPFLNARLQGLGKLGRAMKEDPAGVAWAGARIAAFSMYLAWLNGDDERYERLHEWEKDAYWHIFYEDEHFRIPKPFEIGVIFGTVPERAYHQFAGNQDPDRFLWSVQHNFFETLGFNPIPQFALPAMEAYSNRSFYFDMPIEGMSDEGKLPEARYNDFTSLVMRHVAEATGQSPKMLEHIWDGYLGTMGAYILSAGDMVVHSASDEPSKPEWGVEDLPVVKSFYRGSRERSTQYETDFYDALTEVEQINRTINDYKKNRDRGDDARELKVEHKDKLKHRRQMLNTKKQMSKIRKQIVKVRGSDLSPEEKRDKINTLQAKINDLAKRSVDLSESDFD